MVGNLSRRAFLNAGGDGRGRVAVDPDLDSAHLRSAGVPGGTSTAEAVQQVRPARGPRNMDGRHAVVHLMGAWAGGARLEDTDAAIFSIRMLDLRLPIGQFFTCFRRGSSDAGTG